MPTKAIKRTLKSQGFGPIKPRLQNIYLRFVPTPVAIDVLHSNRIGSPEHHRAQLHALAHLAVAPGVQVISVLLNILSFVRARRSIAGMESLLLTAMHQAWLARDRDAYLLGIEAIDGFGGPLPTDARILVFDRRTSILSVFPGDRFATVSKLLAASGLSTPFGVAGVARAEAATVSVPAARKDATELLALGGAIGNVLPSLIGAGVSAQAGIAGAISFISGVAGIYDPHQDPRGGTPDLGVDVITGASPIVPSPHHGNGSDGGTDAGPRPSGGGRDAGAGVPDAGVPDTGGTAPDAGRGGRDPGSTGPSGGGGSQGQEGPNMSSLDGPGICIDSSPEQTPGSQSSGGYPVPDGDGKGGPAALTDPFLYPNPEGDGPVGPQSISGNVLLHNMPLLGLRATVGFQRGGFLASGLR